MKMFKTRQILTALLLGMGAFSLTGCVQNAQPISPLGLTLSDSISAPLGKESGRGQPIENLVVKYAEDYVNDPYLREDVVAFRRWEWQKLYHSLDQKVKQTPDYLNSYRVQAEAYLINKDYRPALSQLDQILRRKPDDLHALAVSILAAKTLEDETQVKQRLNALEKRSPQAAQAMRDFFRFTESILQQSFSDQPQSQLSFDAIAVFGQSPNPDGSPSKGLLQRLEKTKEMAEKYPNAKLVLSGGPVKTHYAESDVMAKWLKENGVNPNRFLLDPIARDTPGNAIGMVKLFKQHNLHTILGIGTQLHIPRATAVLKGYADYVGYPLKIDGVGGGNPPSAEKKHIEALYTYVNVARSMGLFTLSDFQRFQ
ncbi:YdcF family protein [Rodentibacter caecimuris]|uniref:YdcF family protein n=1 Tax=Rodentibacter caecimuris TaxID=1796644 RepID=UPI0013A09C15|nr:YdcF family protein [Rodentibacter heylii]MCQ9123634.1 YdcF family protein [Rodentibacter heylii]MCX2961285.1 YdcF family protein [Rodentibacter heylii]QIA77121.1 transporter [Rodentibacter heylii]